MRLKLLHSSSDAATEGYCVSLSISQRGPDNIDDIYALIVRCGEDMWARLGLDHWRPPIPVEMLRDYARNKHVYAISDGSELISTFTLGLEMPEPYPDKCWSDPTHRAVYLNKLAVHPGRQGTGLGRWCMEQVERIAREQGLDAVRFDALTRNAPLLSFYDHLGYRRCGDMYVYDEIGRGWDIVVYERVL